MSSIAPIPRTSAFWAHGRLAPYNATRFNVQEARAANNVRVEVFIDGIAIWSKPGATLARTVEEARDLMGLIAAAYTLRSATALDFTFTGWIEATNATFDGTIMGFTAPRGHRPWMNPDGKRSRDMAAAIELAVALFQRGPWRLAVRDVHNAHLASVTRSDDAFVYAARAIEDLAWATSTTGEKSYADLHRHLGTTKTAFLRRTKTLRDARNAVVHGDENDSVLVAARGRMTALIRQSRRIVREAIDASNDLPTT